VFILEKDHGEDEGADGVRIVAPFNAASIVVPIPAGILTEADMYLVITERF
jgi:hypothetical protein